MISLAKMHDLDEIDALAVLVINDMKTSEIPQWTLDYPRKKHYEKDIQNNCLYIYKEKGEILGVTVVLPENDPPYKTIGGWLKEKSIVIHRVLVHPHHRKKGIAQKLMDFAVDFAVENKFESIKIDTHLDNYKMRGFLEKNGFVEIGYLECIDRQAYEKVLEGTL